MQPTPNPAGSSAATSILLGVSCSSAAACTAVGVHFGTDDAESTLAERWNGTRWAIQPTPGGRNPLNAVACRSALACMAVGGDGSTLAEQWNGSGWSVLPTPNPSHGTRMALQSVSCPAAGACVAAGGYVAPGDVEQPLVLRWDGSRWALAAIPGPPGPGVLAGVSCPAASDCTAVGSYFRAGIQYGFAEHWDGTAWSVQPMSRPHGATATQLTSVSCPTTADCTAVGTDSTARGEESVAGQWNGHRWSWQHVPGPAGQRHVPSVLTTVSCRSASLCTAAGFFADRTGVSRALAEQWNGMTWSGLPAADPSQQDAQINAVSCLRGAGCTAVGDHSQGTTGIVTLAEHGS